MSSLSFAMSPGPKILIVADDLISTGNSNYLSYYTDALVRNDYIYSQDYMIEWVSYGDDGPDYDTLSDYDIVIWFTGEISSSTLTAEDITHLKTYMGSGGNLFLSSTHAGFNQYTSDSSFFNDYLNVIDPPYLNKNKQLSWLIDYGPDNIYNLFLSETNNPIIDVALKMDSNIHETNRKISRIGAFDDFVSYEIFYVIAVGGDSIGIATASDLPTHKVVYFGLGFESIISPINTVYSLIPDYGSYNAQTRATLMKNIINYLYTPRISISNIYPEKTKDNITITANCWGTDLISTINASEFYFNSDNSTDGNNIQLSASDGIFDESDETTTITINATAPPYNLNDGTHTVSVHCQDSAGHWGKYDNRTFIIDRAVPQTPKITINYDAEYINSHILNIKINEILGSGTYSIAFSCNNIDFTNEHILWLNLDNYLKSIYLGNSVWGAYGCNATDGEKTIYIRAKSKTGVENITHASDSIILDTIPPQFTSVGVSDPDTFYKAGDNISIEVNMDEQNITVMAYLYSVSSGYSSYQLIDDDGDGIYNFSTSPLVFAEMFEGMRNIYFTATDLAGNSPTIDPILLVTLDKTKPDIPAYIENNLGYTNDMAPEMSFETPQDTPDYISFSCDNVTYSSWLQFLGEGTAITYNSFNITDPTYGCDVTDGNKTIYIRSKDTAENINSSLDYTIILDRNAPTIDDIFPINTSNITHDIDFLINVSDDTYFDFLNFNSTDNYIPITPLSSTTKTANYSFIPSWSEDDGNKNIIFRLYDKANNILQVLYSYMVDSSPSETTDNYTSTDWVGQDQQVHLDCADSASGCNRTYYCVYDTETCTPDTIGNDILINCTQGISCTKTINYRSIDNSGNIELPNSKSIKIDKTSPSITFINPQAGGTYNSIINIWTEIEDSENGTIDYADYIIYNSSQINIANGSLNLTDDWTSSWNSSVYDGIFNLTIFANDSLGNNITQSIIVTIDNALPSATILYPNNIYTNDTSMTLDLRSQKEGSNIDSCTYMIYNQSNPSLNSSEKLNVAETQCNFTDQVDIASWSDGNYSINFSAIDELSNLVNETSLFYIDRIPPITEMDSAINNTWADGTISIDYSTTDNRLIDACKIRYKNTTESWSEYNTISCGQDKSYAFITSHCADTNLTDCMIEISAEDKAGNIKTSTINLNIDNSPPEVSFISPQAGTAFNSNFTVSHTETDHQGQNCSYNIVGTSSTGWQEMNCSEDIMVDVATFCNVSGTCTVYINSTNNVGKTIEKIRTFHTDFNAPQLSSFVRTPSIAKDGTQIRFNATVTDTNGIDTVLAYILSTADEMVSQILLTQIGSTTDYNGTYIVAGSETGTFTVNITANDSLGNKAYDNSTTFFVKNTQPTASGYDLSVDADQNYGNIRIIAGDQISFSVNLSDSIRIDSAIMALKQSGDSEVNYTLTPENYNYTKDTWSATITDTNNRTDYSIYNLYVNDTLGNSKQISQETINLNFVSVVPASEITFDSIDNITIAETNTSLNLTINFNKTMSNKTLTVYIPPNTKTSNDVIPAYLNLTPYQCVVSQGTCTVEPILDTDNNTVSINLNLTGPTTEISLIAQTIRSKVEAIDKAYNWQVFYDSVDYGTSSKIITPALNITSLKCDDVYPCSINQNTSFNISVDVTNEYDAINHTGDFNNLSIIYSLDGIDQSIDLGNLISGNSLNTTFYDLIENPGTYTFTIYATDNISSSYSINKEYSIEIIDTIAPTLVSTSSYSGDIIYSNVTKTMYYGLDDYVGVVSVWATVVMPDSSELNKTLEHTSGMATSETWELNYNDTAQIGTYNITTIYADDTANNLLISQSDYTFEVRDMNINISLNTTSLSVEDTLQINVTIENNISSIESVIVNITKPKGAIEQITLSYLNTSDANITIYSGTYSNITQSDNYTVDVVVSAGGDMSKTSSFFASYGTIKIISAIGYNNTFMIPVDNIYNHSWYIYPVKGDLVDVNMTMNLTDETVLNISDSEIFLKIPGNISYEQYKDGYLIFWELNTTDIGISDIEVNVSSTYSTNMTVTEINVTYIDTEDPVIGNHSSYAMVNLNDTLKITVNATDNTFVNSVIVEVTDPTSTKTNVTAQLSGIGKYTASFDKTASIGNYSYIIYLSDISDNNATSVKSTGFNVTDVYKGVVVPNHLTYNKGETIDIDVLVYDINNRSVSSFNLSLDLVKDNSVSLVNNTINSSAQYKITTADSPTDSDSNKFSEYTFNANVSKYGNAGNISASVNVTNHLIASFEEIPNNKYYVAGAPIPLTVKVTNIRGEETQESIVRVTCPNCPVYSVSLIKVSEYIYSDLERLIAPESVMSFGISADAVDIYKNGKTKDDEDNPIMFLNTDPSSISTNTEGSGVSGAISDVQNYIQDQLDKVFQVPTDDFKFDSDDVINIVTGETVESLTSIENTGDTRLYLAADYSLDCCTVDMIDKFTLELNERRSFPITISSNLSEIPGRYKLGIDIISENISKEYTVVVNLIQNPLVVQLDSFKQDYARLRTLIDDLNFLGVDTSLYEESLRFSKDLIADAQKAVDSNDVTGLESINTKLDLGLGNLDKEMTDKESLKWILENKYSIAGTLISILIMIYLLQGYFVPFISLTRELKDLRKKESTLASEEKATEKEYFTRVIDKLTFSKIMTEKHKQLTDIRTHITHLSKIRSKLLHGHPIYSDEIKDDKVMDAATKKKLMKNFNKESSIVPKNIISMISDLKKDVGPTLKKRVIKDTIISSSSHSAPKGLNKIKAEIMTGPLDAAVAEDPISQDTSEQQSPETQELSTSDITPTDIEPSYSTPETETQPTEDITVADDAEFKRLMDKLKKDLND
ncbi:MAG: hypothetical protein GQ477_04495 [Nanohaloarchaea archaeon]|nr:hypothetical protein [Candidatus Nanohaloarchaea archaeon]